MIPSTLVQFVHHNLYFVWGIVVVGVVAAISGALTASILGYSAGVAIQIVYEKVFGESDDSVYDRRHLPK